MVILLHEKVTHSIVGSSYEVHTTMGFGFMESMYGRALEQELVAKGHEVQREVAAVVRYKGLILGHQRLDMVVDRKVIVEIKASENLHRDAQRQLVSYLRATGLEVGLLLHFSPSGLRFFRQVNSNKLVDSAESVKSARL
jgi:GxxExxY protein